MTTLHDMAQTESAYVPRTLRDVHKEVEKVPIPDERLESLCEVIQVFPRGEDNARD